MAKVSLRGITKSFGEVQAVREVFLDVGDGEFLTFLGPSGCGKSTTLHIVAGLEEPDAGDVFFDDEPVTDLPAEERDVAMVFQSYALYPHMDVYHNIGFGLRMRRVPRPEIDSRVRKAAARLGLEPLLGRKPRELSGGQRQRVALGRALVRDARVFLLDEPLSNLDAGLRVQMRTELKLLHYELGRTFVYVTHDQEEALTLSDRIAVMQNGRIEQVGTPDEIYRRPANRFVAGFIGSPPMNFVSGSMEGIGDRWAFVHGSVRIALGGAFPAREPGARVELGVRPEDIELIGEDAPADGMRGIVSVVEPVGAHVFVTVSLGQSVVKVRVGPDVQVERGRVVRVRLRPERLHLFDQRTGQALRGA